MAIKITGTNLTRRTVTRTTTRHLSTLPKDDSKPNENEPGKKKDLFRVGFRIGNLAVIRADY